MDVVIKGTQCGIGSPNASYVITPFYELYGLELASLCKIPQSYDSTRPVGPPPITRIRFGRTA